MTTVTSLAQAWWIDAMAAICLVAGFLNVWRGLRGGADGTSGLALRNVGMLERMEGFRQLVFGLVLLGVGAAAIWQLEWLFYMAIGIGFVEILESSTLIAVWRRGDRRASSRT